MAKYQIELLNPEVQALLENLVKLNLIKMKEVGDIKGDFFRMLDGFRLDKKASISLEDITREVEEVRANRFKS